MAKYNQEYNTYDVHAVLKADVWQKLQRLMNDRSTRPQERKESKAVVDAIEFMYAAKYESTATEP